MIAKTASSLQNHIHVRFELPAGTGATQVVLVGDFNQWDQQSHPLQQADNGVWTLELDLPQGRRYQFRYLVDGEWWTDGCADGYEPNPYGTQNSIVDTRPPKSACSGNCLLEFYQLTHFKE